MVSLDGVFVDNAPTVLPSRARSNQAEVRMDLSNLDNDVLNGSSGANGPVSIVTRTDVGKLRSRNEDAVAANETNGWIVLADGMGGYRGGDVAARIVVKEIAAAFELAATAGGQGHSIEGVLCEAVRAANRAILREACCRPSLAGMGSTVVVGAIDGGELVLAHVGDSRGYCFADGVLRQLTRDHSLLQERIDEGMISAAEAQTAPGRNLLTRALGVDPEVDVACMRHPLVKGGLYLICSDGLTDMVDDSDIALTLESLGVNLSLAADCLVQLANDRGGRDNITVALLAVHELPEQAGGWFGRLAARLK